MIVSPLAGGEGWLSSAESICSNNRYLDLKSIRKNNDARSAEYPALRASPWFYLCFLVSLCAAIDQYHSATYQECSQRDSPSYLRTGPS